MTGTHGTIRALSKECEVSRQDGLHLAGTRYVGREGKAECLHLLTNSDPEEVIHRSPSRIRKLIALLSLAFIWAHLVGLWRQKSEGPLRRKNHGRL